MSARFGQRALRLFFRCLSISGAVRLDNHERFFDVFLSSVATSFLAVGRLVRGAFGLS